MLRRAQKAAFGNWLSGFAIFTLVALSGFVLFEPAPYEFAAVIFIPMFFISGLRYPKSLAIPTALLSALFVGGLISALVAPELDVAITHVSITGFLSLTALFVAALIAGDPDKRMRQATNAYVISGVIVATLGVAGYLHLIPMADTFTLYDRAKSTFKDPNVFAAFVVFPMVFALLRVLMGNFRQTLIWGAILLLLTAGLFLSYSRGAWGHFAFSAVFAVVMAFIVNRSSIMRMRIVLISAIGLIMLIALVLALLSVDQVSNMFSERAQLTLPYDEGQFGRLNRQFIGFAIAMENPLGIGFRGFAKLFVEDTHNVYLSSLLTYSWLGGISYISLVIITLWRGFGLMLRNASWQTYAIAVYTSFLGSCLEGWIIDTDHWRHWFLLLGMLWGLIAYDFTVRRSLSRSPILQPR